MSGLAAIGCNPDLQGRAALTTSAGFALSAPWPTRPGGGMYVAHPGWPRRLPQYRTAALIYAGPGRLKP